MCDKHCITEEPCDGKLSSTVLESSGSREGVTDFNFSCCFGNAFVVALEIAGG